MASMSDLLGVSPAIAALRAQIVQLLDRGRRAQRLPPLLLQGETGTGKGLLAGLIHRCGPRSSGPFIDVSCAAIPDGLLEAELFGFERGAFTDARRAKPGLLHAADRGTFFLDEVALLSESLQAKFLKVIEEQSVRRLGTTRAESIDVQLVAATNEDLAAAARSGRFRSDLYHRLTVVTLTLPPLRERPEDVLLLAEHFLARACTDYALQAPRRLSPDARAALQSYRWPGNVRELSNVIESAVLFAEGPTITAANLRLPPNVLIDLPNALSDLESGSFDERVGNVEREQLLRALNATGWNVSLAAIQLGISRNRLRYRIERHGLRAARDLFDREPRRRNGPEKPPAAAAESPASATAGRLPSESRHLALLRADLVPTQTAEPLPDPARALAAIADKIRSFDGQVQGLSAASIVAVFGLEPVENAPASAAFAALAIQKDAERARRADRRVPGVKIAVHAAQLMVARVNAIPQIDPEQNDATQAALATLSEVGQTHTILVSAPAAPFLQRRFELSREQSVEGGAQLHYRLTRLERTGFGLGGLTLAPFVGRQHEIGILGDRLAQAERNRGQIVAVVGEPGVGKSRFVYEITRADRIRGWKVMSCRASSYGVSTPSLPVVELLKGYFQIDDAETPSQIREKVSRHILQLDNRLERHLPALFALLDVAVEDPQWHALDPRQRHEHTIAAVDHLLLQESLAQPLLVIFEDLHWVDTETQGLLDSLAQSLPAERVVLLVTYRPEYQHRWGAKTYFTQVRLDNLPTESTVELLGALLGPDPGLAALKQMLVKRGNPFFLEEMVRTLVETGVLAGERGAYRLTCPVDAPRVPDTVQTIVAARIDRLPQAEKQLLQAASAIGKDVPYVLLAAIADQSEEALRRGLTHLQEAEFLYGTQPDAALEALCELMRGASRAQVPVTSFDSYDRLYRFNHAIVQEVVYQNMLMKQREVLHSRVGEVLCAASGESPNRLEEVEALAHHFSLSDNKARAIRYLVEAGDWARRLYANDDALRHYRRAFAVLEVCATTEADRFGVLERLADLLAIAGQRDEALQHYQALLQSVASSDASAKARLHRKIAILYWEAGARDRAHAELQSALGLLQPRDHSIERAFLCHEMGRLAFRSGDHHRAMEWTERAIAAALPFLEEGSQSSGQAGPKLNASAAVVVAEANNNLGIAYARVGQIDYAIAHVERSLQMAAVHGFDQAICRACANLGVLYGNRDPGRAIKLSEQGLEIAQRIGHMGLQSTLYTNLGVAFCTFHVRCDRKGVAAVKKSIELDRRLNLVDHLPMALIALGQLYQCHGQPRQAIDYYREALGLAEALDEPQVLFHCYDGLAAALLDVDDLASARDYLRKAQALCKRTGIDPASLLTMPFLC